MNVVVDQIVAVLKVLPLGDAVRSDKDIDLAGFVRQDQMLFLRPRREQRQQGLKVVALLQRALRRVGAGDHAAVQAVRLEKRSRQVGVEVLRRVREGGEDQNLAVAGIERVRDLAGDDVLQMLQLGVILRTHIVHRGDQIADQRQIRSKVMLPRRKVHV